MASKPRPWSRTGCFSSPRRAKLCQRRCGSTTPTSWPTPTAVCGARVCQYQVKNTLFSWEIDYSRWKSKVCWSLHIFTVFIFYYLQTKKKKKEMVQLKEVPYILWTSKTDLFESIDLIFYSFPFSVSSYSIVRNKLTANSHFTFQINNSAWELLESF